MPKQFPPELIDRGVQIVFESGCWMWLLTRRGAHHRGDGTNDQPWTWEKCRCLARGRRTSASEPQTSTSRRQTTGRGSRTSATASRTSGKTLQISANNSQMGVRRPPAGQGARENDKHGLTSACSVSKRGFDRQKATIQREIAASDRRARSAERPEPKPAAALTAQPRLIAAKQTPNQMQQTTRRLASSLSQTAAVLEQTAALAEHAQRHEQAARIDDAAGEHRAAQRASEAAHRARCQAESWLERSAHPAQ